MGRTPAAPCLVHRGGAPCLLPRVLTWGECFPGAPQPPASLRWQPSKEFPFRALLLLRATSLTLRMPPFCPHLEDCFL